MANSHVCEMTLQVSQQNFSARIVSELMSLFISPPARKLAKGKNTVLVSRRVWKLSIRIYGEERYVSIGKNDMYLRGGKICIYGEEQTLA